MFCGGSTLDGMSPVSKAILDSEAANAVKSYYLSNFEENINSDARLSKLFVSKPDESMAFKSMLNYDNFQTVRESAFEKFSDRMLSISLMKDNVMPYQQVVKTLKNQFREGYDLRVMDFPFQYVHETPFPFNEKIKEEVNEAFYSVFNLASEFLS